ncbi:leucine-rich repeat-containing protein 72 isoform X3 [Colossoma macropomum]|uniref:leucine-rich repeat-containing protein 72 isoform X3 n=1 Tax=Colossoma macropomum TaxID=42526 RepID=UPI0018654A73|nr:leucine-rich repeat-containing protein 72 isoform X3 [Colossoma macropomum]
MEVCRKGNEAPLHIPSKEVHIGELYLAKRGLSTVPDLSRFSQLRYVWLNNNRIKDVHGNMFNCCLAELYLQNNEITSISGSLRHLTCLRVLLLHNNQLKDLEEMVAELRNMHCLQTVKVMQAERTHAFRLFSPERQRILDTLAFGRRALTCPAGRKMTQDTLKLRCNVSERIENILWI